MGRNRSVSRTLAPLKSCIALAVVWTVCFDSHAQKAETRKAEKPTVLVLATYHLHNPGRDVLNVQWDDVLTEKRQNEIRDFVNLLKKYKPTKIAVEVPFGSASLNDQYGRYLRGEYRLTRNEIDQIGFRLAKELNHPRVYGIDAAGAFDIGRVFEFAAANNQQGIVDEAFEVAKRQVAEANKLIQTASVTEIYRATNDQRKLDEGNRAYTLMARIGKGEEYPGAALLADWYERNLKIFSNITRVAESKDDRVLVIIGAGHVKLLQQFIEDSGEYNLERAAKYF